MSNPSHRANCCPEYAELSRRQFMAVTSAATLAAAAAPAWLPRVSLASSYRSTMRDTVISIFLRGAADGLTLCTPYTETNYYNSRPTLAIPRPDSAAAYKLLDLPNSANPAPGGGTVLFGLPPQMQPLLQPYNDGKLAFVHACGLNDPSRSHFDAQRFMEVGKARDLSLGTGWLGRHLAVTDPASPAAVLRGVGIATGLQRALVGGPQTLPVPNLDTFGITGSSTTVVARTAALNDMYSAVPDPLQAAALNTIQTIDLLNTIEFANYVPAGGATYPTGGFGTAMRSVAALLKAEVGVEAVAVDVGGWDTHENEGISTPTGQMSVLMTTLAEALGAFYRDMTAAAAPTFSLVAMSEFGRRLQENGSFGTDHGHGNAMIVMGNAVQGGRVLTQWPGLNPGQLYENIDLNVTIDYRDILAEILAERAGNINLADTFPGYTPTMRGIVA